jgi:hypothetical protein
MNKSFTKNGKSVNILLLMDESGDYINLFSIKPTISLEEIVEKIPNCPTLLYFDQSCSNKISSVTHKQLRELGGNVKKEKKHKTKKNKKI